MQTIYSNVISNMEQTVQGLAARIPAPQRVPYKNHFVYRYVEKTVHQALLQKLVRLVSGLNATFLLMDRGFVQEQASLQRILDEILEDISFLSFALILDQWTPLHEKYLDAFYEEEFDAETAMKSSQKRPMIPRKKIHAWLAKIENGIDPSTSNELSRTLSKAYSGYVHAASPQIMEMYGGNPAKFHTNGLLDTPRHVEHRADLWNYFYRGIIACGFVAKAFGENELFNSIKSFADTFEHISGNNYSSKEWDQT